MLEKKERVHIVFACKVHTAFSEESTVLCFMAKQIANPCDIQITMQGSHLFQGAFLFAWFDVRRDYLCLRKHLARPSTRCRINHFPPSHKAFKVNQQCVHRAYTLDECVDTPIRGKKSNKYIKILKETTIQRCSKNTAAYRSQMNMLEVCTQMI